MAWLGGVDGASVRVRVVSLLRVTRGVNDLVFTEDGSWFVDLISSTGAVFLGHANEAINRSIIDQLGKISCSWTSVMEVQDTCKTVVARHTDDQLALYSLYSSGMEAAEVAMRIAFHETGAKGIIGFQRNNHGKSLAMQNLTGIDLDLPVLDRFWSVPFLPDCAEEEVLDHVAAAFAASSIAAIFVEPMQGRGGGHEASPAFYGQLQCFAREHGALVICDEIFSGFYRTGPCFRYPALAIEPDLVLIGKAISNGFPAAGVLLHKRLSYHPKDFRLNSTFADNPLASAAVVGTLAEMERIEIETQVAHIERAFRRLDVGPEAQLRLHGAACFLELPSHRSAARVHAHLHEHHVLALQRGSILGFWPAATITEEHLDHVVSTTNDGLALAG